MHIPLPKFLTVASCKIEFHVNTHVIGRVQMEMQIKKVQDRIAFSNFILVTLSREEKREKV